MSRLRKYRSFAIDVIRFLLILIFLYILPTRHILDYFIKILAGIENIYLYLIVKLPILLILYYLFEYIDEHNLYNTYVLKKEILNKPIQYLGLIVITLEFTLFVFLYILDKSSIISISSSDWLNFATNLLTMTVSIGGGAFALYQYIENKNEKNTPLIDISTPNDNNCEYHTKFYFDNYKETSISITLESVHRINDIYIEYFDYRSAIYNINTDEKLETLKSNIPINIKLQMPKYELDNYNNRICYKLVVYREGFERYVTLFEVIYNGYGTDKPQIKVDSMKRERI